VEKLTLLQQSKAQNNPAGFFVKAVREDWKNPKLFKTQKIQEAKRAKAAKEQKRKDLESARESLVKELEARKDNIASDYFRDNPKVLKRILQEVKEEHSILGKYFQPGADGYKIYRSTKMVASLVNLIFEGEYPEYFAQLQNHQDKIETLEKKLSEF
ncbi:MAG: hypothetical protein AAFP82_04135, partial [Bacteroidota bacterium]